MRIKTILNNLPVLFTFCFFLHAGHIMAQDLQNESLLPFLGDPFFTTQRLWENGGATGIVTAMDGTLIAFRGSTGMIRLSEDGGLSWLEERSMGGEVTNGNVVLDETNGDILFLNPGTGGLGKMMRSTDNGQTWVQENITLLPDGFGLYPHTVDSMQPGITITFGEHKGRLVVPARIRGPQNSDGIYWSTYHYGTALYSDDGGGTWHTSKPSPVLGNAGAALAEIHDGSIMYNAREFMSRGNRFIAWSHNGGDLWLNAYRSPDLPDGPRGSSYGCMGGLIRLPVDGYDVLVYSNLDTDAGTMPEEPGAPALDGREKITVWVSFDGGKTWPVKRLVFEGPAGNSVLGAGRTDTPAEGKIYLLYEGGEEGNQGTHVAVFNLGWVLEGLDINDYLGEEYALWSVYDGSKLLTEYEEWGVETNGTPPVSGTCYEVVDDPDIPGNKLIKMEDLTDDWKEALQLNWGIDHTRGVTIVFRSKPTRGILDLQTSGKQKKFLYASPRNGTYFDALIIEETNVRSQEYAFKLNQTSGYSTPHTDFGWTVYRLTFKEDSLNVYVNENPVPHFAADVATKNDNFLQFGNNARAPFGAYFDWMAVYLNGAIAPGEGEPLPENLTGLTSHILSLEISPSGAGQAGGEGEYLRGQDVRLTATANEGFAFESWTLNGNVLSTDTAYIFTIPGNDITLTANFRESALGIEPITAPASVYPNPVSDRLHIEAQAGVSVTVFSSTGKAMAHFRLAKDSELLNVSDYPPGIYILKLESRVGIAHVKLIKE